MLQAPFHELAPHTHINPKPKVHLVIDW